MPFSRSHPKYGLDRHRPGYDKEWSDAHPGLMNLYSATYRKKNPEKRRASVMASQRAHPGTHSLSQSRRRARLRGLSEHFTRQEWREKIELFAGICVYCGWSCVVGPDHKVPLSRGGSDTIDNIVPACHPCNTRKNIKTASEYLGVLRNR